MSKKTIIIICSSVLGLFAILIIGVWLISSLKTKYFTYEEVEEKMIKAADKYYKDKASTLPSEEGTYSLDYNILSNAKYIKPLSELLTDGNTCTANVTVIIKNANKTFIPYLNCGEKYATKELYKQILSTNNIVNEGSGLYLNEKGEYYFRGKVENNYVSFGSVVEKKENTPILWRIISINNNSVKLRSLTPFTKKTNWDDRYNENEKKNYGYNEFELSIFKDFLKNESNNPTMLKTNEMAKLTPMNLCVGKRTILDNTIDGSAECSVLSQDQYYFGTITPYEYMRASLDSNCITAESRSCKNLNYLYSLDQVEEWTTISDLDSNYNSYIFDGYTFRLEKDKTKKTIYPVITLNNYTFYKSGNGTINDPYIIK